jgi:3-dehydroquinate synthase
MKTITIQTTTHSSRILIGEKLSNLPTYLPPGKTIIITDEKIHQLYGAAFPPVPVIIIGLGEQNKTMDTLARIFAQLIEYEADRSTFIVAIGGGIVCDVAGFHIYARPALWICIHYPAFAGGCQRRRKKRGKFQRI